MTVNVKQGDRVRVVLEGEVRAVAGPGYWVGKFPEDNCINPNADHVISVEVLAKQFKVGDTVEGDDYADLPVGTVVKHDGHRNVRVKVLGGTWIDPTSPTDYRLNTCFENARKIVFLP